MVKGRGLSAGSAALAALVGASAALGGAEPTPDCTLPPERPGAPIAGLRDVSVAEQEPNDGPASAQIIPLDDMTPDLVISGAILTPGEVDHYRFTLRKGDIIGAALLGSSLDPVLSLLSGDGATTLLKNDDGANVYPIASPFPRKVAQVDSMLTFVAPSDGEYLLRAAGFTTSVGGYDLRVRWRRSPYESAAPGANQTIFVDFDGATINSQAIFGKGLAEATLSPLSAFLADWGLAPEDESALIDAILNEVRADFDALRATNPTFTYTLRNSRDHADPFGQPDVSRVIVGGSSVELGFSTIGVAESIDPGNFESRETAVVLLDSLSSTNVSNVNSVNNVPLDPGFSKIQAVARRVANSISHEAGHYLGCWHTDANNDVFCIMERGGINLAENRFQTGPDGVMGTADDNTLEFIADTYYAPENVGNPPSVQNADARVAFGLTGAFCAADLDRSGLVDSLDLSEVLSAWGSNDSIADLTDDGVVDGRDIAFVLAAWGQCLE